MGLETIVGGVLGLGGALLASSGQQEAAAAVQSTGEAQAQAALQSTQETIAYLQEQAALNRQVAEQAVAQARADALGYFPQGLAAYDTSMNNAVSSLNEWTTNAANRVQSGLNDAVAQYQPYAEVGPQAVQTLSDWTYDPNKYIASPGYQWLSDQGTKAIDRTASAAGRWSSPGTGQALIDYSQGLASQDYNNALGRLGNLVNIGATGASGIANASMTANNNIANLFGNQGTALSNLYSNQGANLLNAYNNLWQQLGNQALTGATGQMASNTSAANQFSGAQNTYLNALNQANQTSLTGSLLSANANTGLANSLSGVAESLLGGSYANSNTTSNPYASYYTNPWGVSLYG